jgi:hypothetical protein
MIPAAPGPAAPARFRLSRNESLTLFVVLVLGLIHLPHPFGWDQSLFTLGAERLAAGGVLYRDFWDLKQPGIYWFYAVAGRLFGFSEPGIHLLELLWMMAFALTLLATLRRRWGPGPAATLAPLFVVGAFYAGATDYYLTQVEGLVGFPLYLTLWFATRGADEEPRAWRAFASGLCGAVVLLFKLVFLPLVGVFWLLALVDVARRSGLARALAVVALPVALGFFLPIAAVLVFFVRLDVLGTLLWTYFTYPAFLLTQIQGGQAARLVDGLQRFLLRFAPLVGLATVGAGATVGRRDSLGLGLVVWLVVGIPVILVQRWSGWSYHDLLLLAPLGVLAAVGVGTAASFLDRAAVEGRAARRLAVAGLIALFIGLLGFASLKGVQLARGRFALTAADRATYQEQVSEHYRSVSQDAALLAAAGRRPGTIFTIENPIVYRLAGRVPAPAFRGVLFPLAMGPAEWAALTERLACAPPAFILIEDRYLPLFEGTAPRAASLAAYLAAGYRMAFTTERGTWYERVR